MSAVPTPAAPRRLGRFEILRILGKGAQGTVYLARDTHLGREVALKTLNLGAAGAADRVRALLDEARLVSRLQHPNIVTLYDAGEDAGAPYLVFEYVEGRPLSAEISEAGRIPPARAAELARQVLKGIALAHAQHVVHRDLKPANIMLSKDGAARVMDFGIARHSSTAQGGERALYGTPAYLPPEYIDRREFTERGDVFATGMVLYEMLTGAPAVSGRTVFEILHRIANEPFAPPSNAAPEVDERLEAIVMRALAKDPAARYESADAMDAALGEWLAPAAPAATDESGTLEFLIRRMRHKSDLPALSNTIGEVNRAVSSGNERASVLCDAILKDFSLTNKLLRMVNTAFFRQYGGAIGTVSRAVAILGFDNVRNVVMSLVLVEHLQNKAQAGPLRDEIAAAYLAGVIGRELAQRLGIRDAEEMFICAMFHRLGKLLATFYLHEEVQAVERLCQGNGLDEARAAREVLGVSYAELGAGIAKHWGFPEPILASMSALPEGPVSKASFDENQGRALAELSGALVDLVRTPEADARARGLAALQARFGKATGLDAQAMRGVVTGSIDVLGRDAEILGFATRNSPLMAAARSWGGKHEVEPAPQGAPGATTAVETLVSDTRIGDAEPEALDAPPENATPERRKAVLASGVQDITQALVGEFTLNDLLRSILETMLRGIGFKRVVMCIRDAGGTALRARFGFGEDVQKLVQDGFAIPLGGSRDVFFAAISTGTDVVLPDLEDPRIAPHVPAWYRGRVRARGMMLFPIVVNKRPVGLIYADADHADALSLHAEELNLLKTLRNQAVLAIRQKT